MTCGTVLVPLLCDNFDSLCSMADSLFLVALNLRNANRKIVKCGAMEAKRYVGANEGSTTNNVHVGRCRW